MPHWLSEMAAGSNDTDAVNVAQLKALETHYISVNRLTTGTATNNYNNDGAEATDSIAIGVGAKTKSDEAIAIGKEAFIDTTDNKSIAIGSKATAKVGANSDASIAIGDQATAGSRVNSNREGGAIAIGQKASAGSNNSIAIGTNAKIWNQGSTAMGVGAQAYGENAIVLGNGAKSGTWKADGTPDAARADGVVALGQASWAEHHQSISIGQNSSAKAVGSISLGSGAFSGSADAGAINSIAIGRNAKSTAADAIAIGGAGDNLASQASGVGSVALGWKSNASGKKAIAIGAATASIENGIAIGNDSVTTGNAGVAGYDARTGTTSTATTGEWKSTHAALAIGNGSTVTRQITGLAAGFNDTDAVNVAQLKGAATHFVSIKGTSTDKNYNNDGAIAVDTIAIGSGAVAGAKDTDGKITGDGAIAIGTRATALKQSSLAIGNDAQSDASQSLAIGQNARNINTGILGQSIALGFSTITEGSGTTAIGANNKSIGDAIVSLGASNTIIGKNVVALGSSIELGKEAVPVDPDYPDTPAEPAVAVENIVALGNKTKADGTGAVAIGGSAETKGKGAIAIGGYTVAGGSMVSGQAKALAESAIAIGTNAKASIANGIALGTGSVTTVGNEIAGYDSATGVASTATTGEWKSTHAALAIGNGSTVTRQITGVAAGFNDTDAVNVAQLKSTNVVVKNVADSLKTQLGVNATVAADGTVTVGTGGIGGTGKTTIDAAISEVLSKANAGGTIAGSGKDGKDGSTGTDGAASKGATGADGLNGKDLTDKVNAIRNGEAGTVVFTDAAGNRLVKANDGKYYLADQVKADGSLIATDTKEAENVRLSLVNNDGKTTTPTKLGNIANGVADNDAVNVAQLKASGLFAEDGKVQGLTFVGDAKASGNTADITRKLGETLNIKGGVTDADKLSENNIGVVTNTDNNTMLIKLAKELSGLTSVTTVDQAGNKTVMNGSGVTITPTGGGKNISITTAGIDAGEKELKNVGTATSGTSAVNKAQMDAAITAAKDASGAIAGSGKDGKDGSTGTDGAASTGATGADGLNGKDLTDKVNAIRNGEAGTVVFTDAAGNRLVKANDGKYYLADQVKADGSLIATDTKEAENVRLSLVNNDGKTTTPTKLGNIANGVADNDAVNVAQLKASGLFAEDGKVQGLTFVGDAKASGNTADITRKLGETLNIKGGVTDADKLSENNIGVVTNTDNNTMLIKLAKELSGLTSVTTVDQAGNKTVMNGSGVTITPTGGGKNISITTAGIDAGGKTISNVGDGTAATDVATKGQMDEAVKALGDSGIGINANTGGLQTHKLGKELAIVAATKDTTASYTSNNLTTEVVQDATTGKTTVSISMKESPEFKSLVLKDGANSTTLTTTANGLDLGGDAITNIAAGTTDTSAVNKKQMEDAVKAASGTTDAAVDNLGEKVATALGGSAAYDKTTNTWTAPSYEITKTDGSKYTAANNIGTALVNLNTEVIKPITFVGDAKASGNTADITRKLGETLNIKGGVTDADKLSENNIGVVTNTDNNTMLIKLAKELSGLTSVTTVDQAGNKTVMNGSGVTITPTGGGKNISITTAGIDAGEKELKNVGTATSGTSAVNKAQMDAAITAAKDAIDGTISGINSKIDGIDSKITTIEGNITNIDNKITTIDNKITTIEGDITTIKGDVTNIKGNITNIDNKITTIEGNISDLTSKVEQAGKISFGGNEGAATEIKGGETLSIKGDATTVGTYSGANIKTVTEVGVVKIQMADAPVFTGKVTSKEGFAVEGGPSMSKDGIDAGNKPITNIGQGSVAQGSNDAVTGGQLFETNQSIAKIGTVLGNVRSDMEKGDAMAAAISALKPLPYDATEPTQIMAGYGTYGGANAVSLGVAHYVSEKNMYNIGVSYGGANSKLMVNAGATWKFGSKKSKEGVPEQYRQGPMSSIYVMQTENTILKDKVSKLEADKDAQAKEMEILKQQVKMLMESRGIQ